LATLAWFAVVTPTASAGFLAPLSFDTGSGPTAVALADFNGDGIADLVTADSGSSTISVLLGKGDGTFGAARSFPTGSCPRSLVVADFNFDGVPDVAVADTGGNEVSVLLGNGDGSFSAACSFPAGNRPVGVVVADVNHDGIADLVVANQGTFHDYPDGSVSVLLGQGDGSFQAAQFFPAGVGPSCVAVADFNHDGIVDLVVANQGDLPYQDIGVSVRLGNGNGTFQAARSLHAGTAYVSVAVADLNGDGNIDLAVADEGSSELCILLGNGDGTFQRPQSYPAGGSPQSVLVGDFTGEGKTAVAVVYALGGVSVFSSNGEAPSVLDIPFPPGGCQGLLWWGI
jgi:hypothetical protein